MSSQKGIGTTFNIHLKASGIAISNTTETPVLTLQGNETILLVDDDPLIRDVGKAILAALGYGVLVAQGGQEAVATYQTQGDRISLVVLDMIMPAMGGGKTDAVLKVIDPEIRVLLSSGYSINGQASAILGRGCNGFIQKPFDLQSLSEKARVIINASD